MFLCCFIHVSAYIYVIPAPLYVILLRHCKREHTNAQTTLFFFLSMCMHKSVTASSILSRQVSHGLLLQVSHGLLDSIPTSQSRPPSTSQSRPPRFYPAPRSYRSPTSSPPVCHFYSSCLSLLLLLSVTSSPPVCLPLLVPSSLSCPC